MQLAKVIKMSKFYYDPETKLEPITLVIYGYKKLVPNLLTGANGTVSMVRAQRFDAHIDAFKQGDNVNIELTKDVVILGEEGKPSIFGADVISLA
jgi:hypothetical protein